MIKESLFAGSDPHGPTVLPLFSRSTDKYFEKTASAQIMPEVLKYIETVKPQDDCCYTLVNALGASEYYSSNVNADAFPEAALIHKPDRWADDPALDMGRGKSWAYGFPTFYGAHVYCFPAGTRIVCGDRTRQAIEDIEVGDLVATAAGPKKVTRVMRRPYQGAGISLLLKGEYSRLTGTEDHPVLVYRRHQIHCSHGYSRLNTEQKHAGHCRELRTDIGEPEWAPLSSVLPGDYMTVVCPEHGTVKPSDDFAELVGWVASEGYLGKKGLIQFSFSENNLADLAAVRRCLAANGMHVTVTPRPQFGLVMLSACSKQISANLAEYISGIKADKTLKGAVLTWCRDSLLRMLGAYIDGDGHVPASGKNRGQLRIRSSSPQMLRILSDIIRALGVHATVQWDCAADSMLSPTNGKTYEANGSGVVAVAPSWAADLLTYTRKDFVRDMPKAWRHSKVGNSFLVAVTERDEVDLSEDVFNLEVEDVHHYFASEMLVHNCHHRNKDPNKSLGDVEFATWNDRMKRVELVTKVVRNRALANGGQAIWDKLKEGIYADVSMGAKVPFDTCFPAGTLIRTATGHKPIEEISLGELVVSHTGRLREVLQLMRRQAPGLTQLVASGLPSISATENHPFFVVRKEQARTCKGTANGERARHSFEVGSSVCKRCGKVPEITPEWVTAESIRPGDYLAVPVTKGDSSHTISPAQARLLGYYLGDGYIIQQRTGKKKDGPHRDMGFGFSAGLAEEHHVQRLLSTVLASGAANEPCTYSAGAGRQALIVSVYDQDMAAWLQKWGGRTSHAKCLPEEIIHWSVEAKMELVAGYIDTDGSCDVRGQVRIGSVNRGLLLDVQRVLLSIGVPATLSFAGTNTSGFGNGTPQWQLILAASQAQKFLGRSVKIKPIEVAWDSPKAFFWGAYWFTPVTSVSEIEEETQVFNIAVDVDESYVAEGRAVHNCAVCLDWSTFREAQATYRPGKHAHEGIAVLEFHKKVRPIRGLAITRADYCVCMKTMMNKILPDGRKVFVYNDYPKFFDISYVFIGADRTAKSLIHIARPGFMSSPSVLFSEKVAQVNFGRDKTAQAKESELKESEIYKTDIPSQFVPAAVSALSQTDRDLPRDVLHALAKYPPEDALMSAGCMGIVLRPREFQRMMLVGSGECSMADHLEEKGVVFPRCDGPPTSGEDIGKLVEDLIEVLLPYIGQRSALRPALLDRISMRGMSPKLAEKESTTPSLLSEPLRKISAAYSAYRSNLMEIIAHAPALFSALDADGVSTVGKKLASSSAQELFSEMTVEYVKSAFWDEVAPTPIFKQAVAGVQSGSIPTKTTWS